MAHHNAQEAQMSLELRACLAQDEMQPNVQPLAERQVSVLELRDQAARVLA
jgi:hypothetical protein